MNAAPIWAAVITALVGGGLTVAGLFYNQWAARQTEQRKAEQEQKLRQRELALRVVEAIAKDPTATRRFAIGLVKVVGIVEEVSEIGWRLPVGGINTGSTERGKTYFIPVNSRISVGRDEKNDIHLYDPALKAEDEDYNRELSRFQCGFVADLDQVVVEDFVSANGTFVQDKDGGYRLEIEEKLEDGETTMKRELRFVKVREARPLVDGDFIWVGRFVLRFVKLQENEMLTR